MEENIVTILRKTILMLIGLFLIAVGVSFSIKAEIGVSPNSCCPVVFSQPLGLSVGMALWLVCCLFLLAQIVILRREFHPFQLLQLVLSFLFGYLTDLTSELMSGLPSATIFLKVGYCALGILFSAIGVFLLLKADMLMLSPDAAMAVISKKYGFEYGRLKTTMDCSMVVIAAIGSLLLYHRIVGIGIGTLASAVLVGMVIRQLKRWTWLDNVISKIFLV